MNMSATVAVKPDQEKWVYRFGPAQSDGRADMKELLGGKGANLAEMCHLGLPVPPGFTLTTEICAYFYENNNTYPEALKMQLDTAIVSIEAALSTGFGDADNPLLLSVRSGARVSMPGMMDTVLNLGLNDMTVEGSIKKSGDARFAWDSYRRFIQMYGNVVLGLDAHDFEDILDTYKRREALVEDTAITAEGWQDIVAQYKAHIEDVLKAPFPQDVHEQLWGAIGAVFKSWMIPRAVTYRRLNNIPEDWGTAVNVQAMVFGNMGEDCATGVAFTRNPSTGENAFYGEFLINAQGEDVVAGVRTPLPLAQLHTNFPKAYAELNEIRQTLENHYKDMQDIEFTVQQKKLYMLQTRTGKRTTAAALRIAVEMVNEDLITTEEAVQRVDASALDQLLHPTLDPDATRDVLTQGLPASPGAASGEIVFSANEAEAWAQKGHKVILCRVETSPEDIHGMHAAVGILTTRGGMTSHAAVVARGMGRPCVAGAGEITIDYKNQTLQVGDQTLKTGMYITLDGTTGEVMRGQVPTVQPKLTREFETLMTWADGLRQLKIRANAETPADAQVAHEFGAEGIGLCRTEHMFFDPTRILRVREMILAEDEDARRAALEWLEPMQQKDFSDLFQIMAGLPVTIRLLDPPLHEFLPQKKDDIEDLADELDIPAERLTRRIAQLHESNPMLGHRGCRLGITYPEIYEMQVRAIFAAAKENPETELEIMIPLAMTRQELIVLKNMVDRVAQKIAPNQPYLLGTMIELPRAALCAGELAEVAEFFSFGTNDLTQTTLGISRDDAGRFLPAYQDAGILAQDPFAVLDVAGVGQLVETGCQRGRMTRPGLKLGVCGEHAGDPASVGFFHHLGMDYVSCSPYRVPIARLAAAQAALCEKIDEDSAQDL